MAAFMAVGIPGNAGSGLSMTAQAAGSGEMAGNVRVFDQADLFLEEEEKELQQAIDALREKMDMDAAVVTAEENPGSAQAYADDFYEAHGFGTGSGRDGALLLIDMDNRELCISTEGKMVRYLTDSRIEAVLDDMYGYAAPETITRQPERLWRIWRSATTTGSPRTSIITTRRPERSAATGRCAGMRPCLPWRLRLPAALCRPGRCERV